MHKNPDFSWSDNICTVGYTCIHGAFTPDRMREILSECPSGRFIQTGLYEYKTISTPEEAEEYVKWYNARNSYYKIQQVRFYFDFPLDQNGIKFLQSYGFDVTKAKFWDRRLCCV